MSSKTIFVQPVAVMKRLWLAVAKYGPQRAAKSQCAFTPTRSTTTTSRWSAVCGGLVKNASPWPTAAGEVIAVGEDVN